MKRWLRRERERQLVTAGDNLVVGLKPQHILAVRRLSLGQIGETRGGLESLKRLRALPLVTPDAHIDPSEPKVRRNLDRVHDHVLHPRITN